MPNEMAQDASLLQDFLTECDELLEHLSQDLVALESHPNDPELLNQIFRAFHTIKGTSGFMGFHEIVSVTHHAEDVLNLMRKGERQVTPRAMDVFLNVLDQLRQMFDDVRDGGSSEYQLGDLLGRLQQLMQGETNIRTPLGEILVDAGTITPQERTDALKEAVETDRKLGDVLVEKQTVSVAQIQASVEKQSLQDKPVASQKETKEAARTIRVDVNKLDELVNLTGELVLERNRMAQLSRDFVAKRFSTEDLERSISESSSRLSFITQELQAASLKTRMIPIDVVFRKFPRIVRDLSSSLSKQCELVIRGEDTELDKTIVEEISDPLVHLVRNSLDHGIETPAAREKSGKSPKGTLRLEARAEGDVIIIQVSDDGAGIDPARISSKAIERGVVTPERVRSMTRREILDLIFLPGFSTAEKTTDVSGRGVGMDVVKTNLKKLNGVVELDSEIGRGSIITLKLPLTLAILPVLLVQVCNGTYALPLRSVSEILRVDPESVHQGDAGEILHIREEVIPIGRLWKVFKLGEEQVAEDGRLRVVILAVGDKKIGLVVDDFLGQEETVIKPLGAYFGHVAGVAGSTITGEGNVRLILDPAGIVEMLSEKQA